MLPGGGYGASRLLIAWARERGLRVGLMQHGMYSSKEVEDGERRADVVFGWGEATVEQVLCWREPRPALLPAGVPGMPSPPLGARASRSLAGLTRALIATTGAGDTPLARASTCEIFVEVIAPALRRLTTAGVELELRPHPTEDPARYRRLLDVHELDVSIAHGGPFLSAAARADIVISSMSSVAFEAGGLGLPVLLWMGGAPRWVRQEHLVPSVVGGRAGDVRRGRGALGAG